MEAEDLVDDGVREAVRLVQRDGGHPKNFLNSEELAGRLVQHTDEGDAGGYVGHAGQGRGQERTTEKHSNRRRGIFQLHHCLVWRRWA